MKYCHRFQVKAPLASVAAFHRQPGGMSAITPPPIRVQVHRFPNSPSGEGEMDFTLRFGPLPIRWLAKLEQVSESGFTDRQLQGPFSSWVHRHSFVRLDETMTEVVDEIHLALKPHLVWGAVGLAFAVGLPVLFAYRGWKTRRLLEKSS